MSRVILLSDTIVLGFETAVSGTDICVLNPQRFFSQLEMIDIRAAKVVLGVKS